MTEKGIVILRKRIVAAMMALVIVSAALSGDMVIEASETVVSETQSTEEENAASENMAGTEVTEVETERATEETEEEIEKISEYTRADEMTDETEVLSEDETEALIEEETENVADKTEDVIQETESLSANETEEASEEINRTEDAGELAILEDDPLAGRAGVLDSGESNDDVSQIFFYNMYGGGYQHNPRYNGMTVRDGIDVSYYQGDINWNAVRDAGIEYAIIRVGYRGYQYGNLKEDPKFRQNLQGATAAGLKVGVYIFSQAVNEAEAAEEARYLLDRIGGYHIELPIVMDFEYVSGVSGRGRLYQAGLSKDRATSVCSAFCDTVINAGYTPMIYANKSMLENQVDGNYLGSKYKIWLANYTTQTSYAGPYTFWQYSSSGSVNGISGRVDMNFWYDESTYQPTVSEENASGFVRPLYANFLEREADAEGLRHWVARLQEGNTGAEVAYGFVFSQEFTMHNYSDQIFLERLYQGLMGRVYDDVGIADWKDKLAHGVSREYVFKQFVDSAEFTNMCNAYGITKGTIVLSQGRDGNYQLTRFVGRNYTEFLGRDYDIDGLNYWCSRVLAKQTSMADLAGGFVFSAECKNKNLSNAEFVEMLYKGCFDRDPDQDGFNRWVNDLDAGSKNREEVFQGFVNSVEFYNMVRSYGL